MTTDPETAVRLRALERRVRNLQVSLVVVVLMYSTTLYLEHRRNVFPLLFTDTLTIPYRFWSAPSFLNVGTGADSTALTFSRLSSNEELRLESGKEGTRVTFRDAASKKRLSIGISPAGEPFVQAYDRSSNAVPLSSQGRDRVRRGNNHGAA